MRFVGANIMTVGFAMCTDGTCRIVILVSYSSEYREAVSGIVFNQPTLPRILNTRVVQHD